MTENIIREDIKLGNNKKNMTKPNNTWNKVDSLADKTCAFLGRYVAVFFTPVFAILNYHSLTKKLNKDDKCSVWISIFFFSISVIYAITTLALALYSAHKDWTAPIANLTTSV